MEILEFMKELSIEEKAKRYDETIERAKIKRDEYIRLDGPKSYVPQDIEFIFPELAESEDERIRNNLIDYFSNCKALKFSEQEIVAWLEKQGEQNPTDKIIERARTEKQRVLLTETNGDAHIDWDCRSLRDVKLLLKYGLEYIDAQLEKQGEKNESKKIEPWTTWISKESEKNLTDEVEVKPKFKVGDWIVTPDNEVKQIEKVTFGNYWFTDESIYNIIDVDNKWHLWTIQDAKDGDVLANGEMVLIFKQFEESFYRNHIIAYVGLDINGRIQVTDEYWTCIAYKTNPATKEQRGLLFSKMKEAGYEWDAENKVLRKIELKSPWSEEDEERYVSCLQRLGTGNLKQPETINTVWLKSLKERVQLV